MKDSIKAERTNGTLPLATDALQAVGPTPEASDGFTRRKKQRLTFGLSGSLGALLDSVRIKGSCV